jgi:Polyketide cyclase / dehydrase and lipid transport
MLRQPHLRKILQATARPWATREDGRVPRVEATVIVTLDPERTFALSQTYGELRYRWDPFVREQRLLDGAERAGPGVRTWTRSRHRLVMLSEYVTFRPPRHVGMRMVQGPWFFKTFSGGWNFAATADGGTEATWRYNFTCRPVWLAPIAHRIGVWLLGRDIRRRLDAFARACADPEIVSALLSDDHK